nr:IucA/IucC family siderophore biosynthesis protein [uncultured Caldimonas sp.]
MIPNTQQHPAWATQHLQPDVWAHVNRHLVRKAICEFSHELVLAPERTGRASRQGFDAYRLPVPESDVEYRFDAQPMALRHWRIDAASIRKLAGDEERPLDALEFVLEFKEVLGLKQELLPVYLDEISSTLYGAAYKHTKGNPTSAELADADYQTLEASMTEGHPGFVANNGRLGFDALDYPAYTPEAGARFEVVWLAVHREHATFASTSDLPYEQLLAEELGESNVRRFEQRLQEIGADPADYVFMPTHPWQWFNKLAIGFAAEIAQRHIVCLGYSEDRYAAQQSIRTYFNVDRPHRRYVKTSLSILNMGFMRGLSPYYMSGTPAINEWLRERLKDDPWLRANGFAMLHEVASVGYRNRYYEAATPRTNPYRRMLSALWRESPLTLLRGQERLMTMTALLHVDHEGQALLPELIRRSGRTATDWLQRYLRAYLAPLLHCFYAHDLVFMPHGENLILVLDGHTPVRAILKDIAEETALLDKNAQLPGLAQRMVVDVPEDYKLLGIFIDVFDGYFRHLSQILVDNDCCSEDEFWSLVAACVADYQAERPDLQHKFERYDMFAPEFLHSCLNRLQLSNNQQMVDLGDQASSLKMAGMLTNPIARFRPSRTHVDLPVDKLAA